MHLIIFSNNIKLLILTLLLLINCILQLTLLLLEETVQMQCMLSIYWDAVILIVTLG